MKKSLFIVLAFALLNAGCSTVSLVYRNADWYLARKINSYTSFDAPQKVTIREEVSDYMQWHRKVALPEYIIFLQNLNGVAQYDGKLKVEEVAQLRVHLLTLYRKTVTPAIRPAAKLLSNLTTQQILALAETFNEENQEQKEELLEGSEAKRLEKRADRTLKFTEWLVGDLSAAQALSIREMNLQLPLASHIYIQHREDNQAKLVALLSNQSDADIIAAFLTSWLHTPDASRTPQQQQQINSFELAANEMIARIHGQLTAQQRAHLHKKITSYMEDIQNLTLDENSVSISSP